MMIVVHPLVVMSKATLAALLRSLLMLLITAVVLSVHDPAAASGGLDLRVTRGLGPKGYGKLRISAITHGPRNFSDFQFEYSEQFKFRWTAWADAERHKRQAGSNTRVL